MRIVNTGESFDTDTKRFYVPARVYDNCPTCGLEREAFETQDYFSYPDLNGPEEVSFNCGDEVGVDHKYIEWQRKVVIRLTLEESP